MKTFQILLLIAVGWILGAAPKAWAIPMFARMYSYNCSTCHAPGYGQLNKFGWEFRDAGFRLPADIGVKEPNDGKFELSNYFTLRYSAGVKVTSTVNADRVPIPDNATFTYGSPALHMGGAFGKNFTLYTEIGMGNGAGIFSNSSAPALSVGFLGYVTGNEDQYFTFRIGKFPSFDGYSGSDRGPIGNPAMNSSIKTTEVGAEVGATLKDTRIVLAVFNGTSQLVPTGLYKGTKPVSIALATNTADTNNAKDIQLFVNQFIGEDGAAISGAFYNGFTGGVGDGVGTEFFNAAVWFNMPIIKKLDFKIGGLIGQTNMGLFSVGGIGGAVNDGWFSELDYELDEITPLVLRYDYTMTDESIKHSDTHKVTLGALLPFIENVYVNPQYSWTVTSNALGYNNAHAFSANLNLAY